MTNTPAGPYSIGSTHWPGLSKLIEECGQTLQICGKLLGTGGAVEHWDGEGNLKNRLEDELADLTAAIQFVQFACGLDAVSIELRVEEKLERFELWHREQSIRDARKKP